MQLKNENSLTKNRTKLLGFLQTLKVSIGTKLKIGRMLDGISDEQAEGKAKQIFDLISSCKDESEVLVVLSDY